MADYCYDCNHPERFHVNDWNGYRGIPKAAVPCRADLGQCGCPEFIPEPVPVGVPPDRIRDQIEAIARVNRISFDEAHEVLRDLLVEDERRRGHE